MGIFKSQWSQDSKKSKGMEWLSQQVTTKYGTPQSTEETMVKKHNVDLLNTKDMERSWAFTENVVMYYRKPINYLL